MLLLQDLIHKIEVGMGARYLRMFLAVLVGALLIGGYNLRAFRNFSSPEAMDQAQLARNLAEGRGYTTEFLRPFSLFLFKRANEERLASLTPEQKADLWRVKGPQPDVANPPVYPVVLAGLMKAAPFLFDNNTSKERSFWWRDGAFARCQSDFVISFFNQLLLLVLVWQTFRLARRLFDEQVAWLSALLLLGTELLWRFSVAGLSTLLLLVLFMALMNTLVRLEAATREETVSQPRLLLLGAAIGALLGIGLLTRYAYGFLLLPVLGFVLLFTGRARVPVALVITAVFAAVAAPWIIRNLSLCGAPFGTAGYAVIENSAYFPGHKLERSLSPNLSQIGLTPLWWKFFTNLRGIVLNDLFKLGGSWVSAFFLVGLLFGFRNPSLRRLRYLALAALPVLIVVQAIGRTALSDDQPDLNSENLLVLLLPLVLMFGVSFFLTLLDQMTLPFLWLRYAVIGAFCGLMVLPMVFTFLPPKTSPIAFPPYHPPTIQKIAAWMREDELVMSDVPWAVAWYGHRPSVLLTLDADEQFYTLNDFIRPVRALYLTPQSLDAKFLSQWARGGSEMSWGTLIINSLSRNILPPRFPLSKSVRLPEQLFLSDWERWLKPAEAAAKP